jgi:opacity protein-like surface antigen
MRGIHFMRRTGFVIVNALAVALSASPGAADGVATRVTDVPALFDWRGGYVGYHSGGVLGLADIGDPYGPSIFGDTVRTPGMLAGGQVGYNWLFGRTLLGLEADASWADTDGTNTCLAFSGFYVGSNCHTHIDALGTLTGRIGWALGDDGRTLLYAKGGAAWAHAETDVRVNGGLGYPGTSADGFRWGYTLGAGAERALNARWSLRAEYDFLSVDGAGFTTPVSGFQAVPDAIGTLVNLPGAASDVALDMHVLKLGVNYRLGESAPLIDPDFGLGTLRAPGLAGWELEAGARYVYGWGRFQKDLGGLSLASLESRLTYENMTTNGAELFARLDTPSDVMVKGMLGAGSGGGHMNDEDWGVGGVFPLFVPYSNTLSDVDNDIRYGTVDVGYDWWRGEGFRAAPFIGYSYLRQVMDVYGCRQIANQNSDCVPPVPASVLAITESDTWQALRLGTAVDFALAPRLTLSGEAAYLPFVSFAGTDDHILRGLLSPEDGQGIGVQLEAMLTYAITDAWSVGVGGRYWAMWTTSGDVNFGGTGQFVPMEYRVEQAAVLVQGTYRFGTAPKLMPLK